MNFDKEAFKYAWHVVRRFYNLSISLGCDYSQFIGFLAQSGADWQAVYSNLSPRAYYIARRCYIVGKNPNPTNRRRKRKSK